MQKPKTTREIIMAVWEKSPEDVNAYLETLAQEEIEKTLCVLRHLKNLFNQHN